MYCPCMVGVKQAVRHGGGGGLIGPGLESEERGGEGESVKGRKAGLKSVDGGRERGEGSGAEGGDSSG